MSETEIQLTLTIVAADADPARLDEMTIHLRRELLDLGADIVQRPHRKPAPIGSKGAAPAEGALDVAAGPTFLPRLFGFLQSWSQRDESRTVKIKTPQGLEIEFTPEQPLSQAELLALVNNLVAATQRDGPVTEKPPKPNDRTRLRQLLSTYFDEGELQTLCFDLGFDYENLPAVGKANKARELLEFVERHGLFDKLLEIGEQTRPDVPWHELKEAE